MKNSPSASPSAPTATEPDTPVDKWYERFETIMGAVEHHKWKVQNSEADFGDEEDADEELWATFDELEQELWAEGE